MSLVGNRIREVRKFKKMSQTILGENVGVGKTTISNYETGYSLPDIETLAKIASTLNVSTDYLVGINNNQKEFSTNNHYEIEKIIDKTEKTLLNEEGLTFNGKPVSKETKQRIIDAMKIGIEMAKREENEREK